MDARVINAARQATRDLFSTMIPLPLVPGEPRGLKEIQERFDVTGSIGLSGDCPGAVGLRFPKLLAAKVASAMLGSTVSETSIEIQETVGELTNMIAGGMKNILHDQAIRFDISLPTVIVGDNHTFNIMADTEGMAIPFDVQGLLFVVEVCLKKK